VTGFIDLGTRGEMEDSRGTPEEIKLKQKKSLLSILKVVL
jgi:hypothetical protein